MIYCDTSVMVAALTAEANSATVRDWLDEHRDQVAISGWVITEFSGALAMKRRLGVLPDSDWRDVMQAWRLLCADSVTMEPVSETDFSHAASLMDREDIVLRSGDALHLSVAIARGLTLATLDKKLAAAAATIGVSVETIGGGAPKT